MVARQLGYVQYCLASDMSNHWFGRIALFTAVVTSPLLIMSALGGGGLDPMTVQSLTYGLACTAVVGIEHARRGSSALASGFLPTPHTSRMILFGTMWALLVLIAVLAVALVVGAQLDVLAETTFSASGLSTIILFAIGEEVVFRGTLLESLHERFGAPAAIVLTSALFALAHAGNPGASLISSVNVALAGIALGTAVVVSSSLWVAIAFHVVWNLALSAVFGVVSGLDLGIRLSLLNTTTVDPASLPWITGPFGIEEGYITTVLLLVSIVAVARRVPYDPYVRAARFHRTFSS